MGKRKFKHKIEIGEGDEEESYENNEFYKRLYN